MKLLRALVLLLALCSAGLARAQNISNTLPSIFTVSDQLEHELTALVVTASVAATADHFVETYSLQVINSSEIPINITQRIARDGVTVNTTKQTTVLPGKETTLVWDYTETGLTVANHTWRVYATSSANSGIVYGLQTKFGVINRDELPPTPGSVPPQNLGGGGQASTDRCGTLKPVSSTSNCNMTFPPPGMENAGCVMTICNVNAAGSFTITIQDIDPVHTATGSDYPIAPESCTIMSSTGVGGAWYQAAGGGGGSGCVQNVPGGCVGITLPVLPESPEGDVRIGPIGWDHVPSSDLNQRLTVLFQARHAKAPGDPDVFHHILAGQFRTEVEPLTIEDATFQGAVGELSLKGTVPFDRGVINLGAAGGADIHEGVRGFGAYSGSSTVETIFGVGCRVDVLGAPIGPGGGLLKNAVCFGGEKFDLSGGGDFTNAIGLLLFSGGVNIGAGSVIQNLYGVYVSRLTPLGSGTLVNTPYSFYASELAARNYFAGVTGIGPGMTIPWGDLSVGSTKVVSPRGVGSVQMSTDALGAQFNWRKARGTATAPTAIVTDDDLGQASAWGYDGTNYLEMGALEFDAEGTIAAGQIPTRFTVSTATNTSPSVLTERMRISSAGYMGLGTTNPTSVFYETWTHTDNTVDFNFVTLNNTIATPLSSTREYDGLFSALTFKNAAPLTSGATNGALRAYSYVDPTAAGNITAVTGVVARAENNSPVTVTNMAAFKVEHLRNLAAGSITTAYGLQLPVTTVGSGDIGTLYGVFMPAQVGATLPTTAYGMYVGNQLSTAAFPFFYDGIGTNLKWAVSKTGWQGIGTAVPATELEVSSVQSVSPRGIMSSQYTTGTEGARLHLRKGRGTHTVPTVVVTGDTLGKVVASGYDGTAYQEMGSLEFDAEGTVAAGQVPTRFVVSTATDASPSVLTERLRIDSVGRLGLNTTGPTSAFHQIWTHTDGAVDFNFVTFNNTIATTTASTREYNGLFSAVTYSHTAAITSTATNGAIRGYVFVSPTASAALATAAGVIARAENNSPNVVTSLYGFKVENLRNLSATGSVTTLYGVAIPGMTAGTGGVTTAYGFYQNQQVGTVATTGYGIYIGNMGNATAFPFYYDGTSTNLKWAVTKAGWQGIGTIAPVSELHVASTQTTLPRGILSTQHSADANGGLFEGRKSRGTAAVPTIITTADFLGGFTASGYDGASYLLSGSMQFESEGTIAATRVPSRWMVSTATNALPSVLTERLRIDSAGLMTVTGTLKVTTAATANKAACINASGVLSQCTSVVDASGGCTCP